jgi:hypothetical protein
VGARGHGALDSLAFGAGRLDLLAWPAQAGFRARSPPVRVYDRVTFTEGNE